MLDIGAGSLKRKRILQKFTVRYTDTLPPLTALAARRDLSLSITWASKLFTSVLHVSRGLEKEWYRRRFSYFPFCIYAYVPLAMSFRIEEDQVDKMGQACLLGSCIREWGLWFLFHGIQDADFFYLVCCRYLLIFIFPYCDDDQASPCRLRLRECCTCFSVHVSCCVRRICALLKMWRLC